VIEVLKYNKEKFIEDKFVLNFNELLPGNAGEGRREKM